MKKLIILILLVLVTGCTDKNYIELPGNAGLKGITYKFTGESETFKFGTGIVFYEDVRKELLITNVSAKKDLKVDKMNVYLYLDSKEYRKINYTEEMIYTPEEFLENIFITDYTILSRDSDSLLSTTTRDSIRDDLEVYIETCLKNKCNKEKLKLKYSR